jgi:protein O-mannosyl-transferase
MAKQNIKTNPTNTPKATKQVDAKKKTTDAFGINWLFFLAVLVLTIACFYPSFSSDFVNWDDGVNVYDNKFIKELSWESIKAIFSTNVIGNYNPLPIVTFAIENHFFGNKTLATLNDIGLANVMHITNLILHLVTVYWVYRICLKLEFAAFVTMVVTVLFAIHPMRVESVAWVTERKDVLFGAFYFASLFYYISFLKSNKNIYLLICFVLFVFSLFSKIQAVSLPLSMLAIDYYLHRPIKWNLLVQKIPFFLASLAVGIIGVMILSSKDVIDGGSAHFNILQRIFVASYSYVVYTVKCIYPYIMSGLYPYPIGLETFHYLSLIPVIATIVFLWYAWKKGWTHVVFGIMFFLVNFVFVSQIVGAGQGYLADRFTYVGYFGFFYLLAQLLYNFKNSKPNMAMAVNIGIGAYLILFAYMTYAQTQTWKNSETLWTQALKYEGNTDLPYGNRGNYYREQKMYDKAMADYNKALELKQTAPILNSRGKLYFDNEKTAEAINDYTQSIALDPKLGEVWVNRGAAYGKLGKLDSALVNLNEGVKLDSANKNGYKNRYMVLYDLQQHEKALSDIDHYLAIDKTYNDMNYERAITLRQLKRDKEAMESFNIAIQNDPTRGIFYLERSKCHLALGNKAQAVTDYQSAIQNGVTAEPAYEQMLK